VWEERGVCRLRWHKGESLLSPSILFNVSSIDVTEIKSARLSFRALVEKSMCYNGTAKSGWVSWDIHTHTRTHTYTHIFVHSPLSFFLSQKYTPTGGQKEAGLDTARE